METSDEYHGKLFHKVDASQSEFCSRKRKYPDFIDSNNLKVENNSVNSDISELNTNKKISMQFPSIFKDKVGLITNLINPNYGLATIGFEDIGIVCVLFDTCEFWHDGSTLSQQNLVLQNVVSEGDWVKMNAIKVVQKSQEDRNILYLATDIVKVENTFSQDWCNVVQVNDLGDLPKEKIATFNAVTTYLKSVPLSKREKEISQSMKCQYLLGDVSVTLKTLCKTEEEAKGKVKVEKPFVVPKDPNYKNGNTVDNPKVVPSGLRIVSVEDLISVPNLVPKDVLQDTQESRKAKYNTKQKVIMAVPKGVPKERKDKKGNVILNPNVVPLGKTNVKGEMIMEIPKASIDKNGSVIVNPNAVPLGLRKPCTFGGKASAEGLISVPNLDPKDILKIYKDIQESKHCANMIIPRGVPKMTKDKKGNILENPNVASLGSKKQCTFGGNLDGVSIIKWR